MTIERATKIYHILTAIKKGEEQQQKYHGDKLPCQTRGKRKESKASWTGVRRDRLSEQIQTVNSAHKHWNMTIIFSTLKQANSGL